MEALYAHYVDHVITNGDLQRTVNELGEIIHCLENEPQWIPAQWLT